MSRTFVRLVVLYLVVAWVIVPWFKRRFSRAKIVRASFSEITAPAGAEFEVSDYFLDKLRALNAICLSTGIKLIVTSAFRRDTAVLTNPVVAPAQRSNHFIGEALDVNFLVGDWLIGSDDLANDPDARHEIKKLTDLIPALGLRYGGNFNTPDYIHIDSGLNLSNPSLWSRRLKELQS